MKAVIMAGGEGSRLRPLTCDRPKPLVPVCNRPVMAYILDLLAEHGFQEIFVTLGYLPDAVSQYFGASYRSMRIHYAVEDKPLGTAGGVAALREHLTSTFLVISGDALTDVDLNELLQFHRRSQAVVTLAMTRVENPLEYGVLMTDRAGRVRKYVEKPGWGEVFSDTVNTGIYVVEPSVLVGVPPRRSYDFSQHLFPALLQMDAPMYGMVADGYWCDIGDAGAYLQANLDLLAGQLRFRPPGHEVVPGVWAEDEVPHGLTVDGPVLIGAGCALAPGTRLEGGVVLGPGTAVGPNAILRRTVTWGAVRIGAGATLLGTVLCEGGAVAGGAGVYEGAVIGPHCDVGARATVAPGVRLWPGTAVQPGARVDTTLVQSPVWSGRLLHRGGLVGRLGSDLFPETALRAGTAFASVLADRGPLVAGCDPGAAPDLLKQALVCGALAAGRNVVDIGTTASPVTEYTIARQQAAGGMHVRWSGDQARVVFYDGHGRPATRDLQRKLEQACARQDFPRAAPEAAGSVERMTQAEWLYLEFLQTQIDVKAIYSAGISVEIEGEAWPALRRWLERLRCDRTGDVLDRRLRILLDPLEAAWRLAGYSPEAMLSLDVWLSTTGESGPVVPIPATAPGALEAFLLQSGRHPVRVRQADWRSCDPLLGIARLLEWMALENLTEADVLDRLPVSATTVTIVACPWEAKGRVMRRLLEEHADATVDLVDGLRVRAAEGWALLLPDPDEPVYRVYTEAVDHDQAQALAVRYTRRLEELLAQP